MAVPLFISKRELARAWHIGKVISRYGMYPLAEAIGLGWLFRLPPWPRRRHRLYDLPPPVRLRMALVELGTTFIKLGQVLSARSDLLPPEYLAELSKLQDEVPAMSLEPMEQVFREEFGIPPAQAYGFFDSAPFASASIGQVYKARLHNGDAVIVKIQRPGVKEQVNTDLALMQRIANYAHRHKWLQRFDLPAFVREFSAIIQDELLYTLEAHNAETLARQSADRTDIIFPRVYWPLTSERVLTEYRIKGTKITHRADLLARGINPKAISASLATSLLEQILLYGMFHGDPHPGNLLVTDDGKLAFIDTGMVGRLDKQTRETLIELAVAIFDQDIDSVLGSLQQLGVVGEFTNPQPLRRDLSMLITKYYFLPRKELRLGALLQRVNNLLFEHRIRMAYEFGLIGKVLFLGEGIAQELNPDFDYNVIARPVIDKVQRQYFSPQKLLTDTLQEWRGLRNQIIDFPRRANTILSHLENGTIRVRLTDDLWEERQAADGARWNRAALAIIIGSLLITGTLLMVAYPSGWQHYAGLAGLIAAGIMLPILIAAILRSGRLG